MLNLIPSQGMGVSFVGFGLSPTLAQATTERPERDAFSLDAIGAGFGVGLGEFLPRLLGAILLLVVGIIAAYIVAWAVKSLLDKTSIDDRLAASVTGRSPDEVPAAKWISSIVFWIIALLAVVGFLETLNLTVVSEPLNNLVSTILEYLPRIFSAAILLAVAWGVATIVKTLVTQGLSRFNLDDRLAENTGVDPRQNSVQIHETLGNALYWLVFLLFLPLILNALELNGLLQPVQNLIDQFFAAIPQILKALLIFGAGWLLAKIARSIVTNLLAATGVDNLGHHVNLSRADTPSTVGTPGTGGQSVSSLVGILVYVLILIPSAIAALNALNIDAISDPAISMLERILDYIPLLLAAGVVLAVFYFIGKFIGNLVTSLLASAGFDNILEALGLPDIAPSTRTSTTSSTTTTTSPPAYQPSDFGSTAVQPGSTTLQPPTDVRSSAGVQPSTSTSGGKSPSEIVGLIVLVGVVLFGAVTAVEILQLPQLTLIVTAILEIAGQVLIGVLIFGIGLYISNLIFRLIRSSSSASSNTLAQAARIAILAFVGAMALTQMGVAPNIVNLTFGLLLGAVAVAIAIAFGLGGRDVASEELRDWIKHLKR
ncbi:MAG: mechanosensitive ion channel [Phormidesmis sp.]